MEQKNFDLISLDWGDTLATNHGNPYRMIHQRAFRQLAVDLAGLGVPLPQQWPDQLLSEFMHQWRSTPDPALNPDMVEMDADGLIRQHILTHLPHAWNDDTETALMKAAATCSEIIMPMPGVDTALRQLVAAGYRLAICSLVPWSRKVVQAWYQRRGWDQLIDHYSLSSEVGYFKPSPRHYQDLIDGTGVAPKRILHVGDHPLRDV
ncbi:MAG: HAD family hydrolase, partial [Sphaerospermopsis sp. SIO1G2]|nr:HAD family hydrolase [Sphaerospermopsis sp. SIO1G2]